MTNCPQGHQSLFTQALQAALDWLRRHNGDGVFDRTNVLLAAGERAPVMFLSWQRLEALGYVEFYIGGGKAKRLRVTAFGMSVRLGTLSADHHLE